MFSINMIEIYNWNDDTYFFICMKYIIFSTLLQ